MDKQPPPAPGQNFNVVIIGAGGINFGSVEGGPWNHSFRLEHKVRTIFPFYLVLDGRRLTGGWVLSWDLDCVSLR